MIVSISKDLYHVEIPSYEGELKMIPFSLATLSEIPQRFKNVVSSMIKDLPVKKGIAYLTVDGRVVKKGETHRRGGPHIDGNYYPEFSTCGSGGNGWKVGEGGNTLNSDQHKQSYCVHTGGMIIASTIKGCKGWDGFFDGEPGVGGDCSHIELNEGFWLEPNMAYYGSSQFIHESMPIQEDHHRTLIRITLPPEYSVLH